MSSVLYRIPFILANEAAYAVALNPPEGPPSANEQKRYAHGKNGNGKERLASLWFSTGMRAVLLSGFHAVHLCDALASAGLIPHIPILKDTIPAARHNMHVSPALLIGTFLSVAGTGIRVECYRALGRFFTLELAIRDGHKLITHGPYSVVRHPSYTGFLMMMAGQMLADFGAGSWWRAAIANSSQSKVAVCILTGLYLVLPLFALTVLFSRVRKEDLALKESFGQEWIKWSERTRYRLLPGIY